MPDLRLGLVVTSPLVKPPAVVASSPPPGTLDFSKPENSALLILLEDF